MTREIQHDGDKVKVIKSLDYLRKSDNIKITKLEGGYKEMPKQPVTDDIDVHVKNVVESNGKPYLLNVKGDANYGSDKLTGKFDLFYSRMHIRIEAVTSDLEEKLSEELKSAFIAKSDPITSVLLDLIKVVFG